MTTYLIVMAAQALALVLAVAAAELGWIVFTICAMSLTTIIHF